MLLTALFFNSRHTHTCTSLCGRSLSPSFTVIEALFCFPVSSSWLWKTWQCMIITLLSITLLAVLDLWRHLGFFNADCGSVYLGWMQMWLSLVVSLLCMWLWYRFCACVYRHAFAYAITRVFTYPLPPRKRFICLNHLTGNKKRTESWGIPSYVYF